MTRRSSSRRPAGPRVDAGEVTRRVIEGEPDSLDVMVTRLSPGSSDQFTDPLTIVDPAKRDRILASLALPRGGDVNVVASYTVSRSGSWWADVADNSWDLIGYPARTHRIGPAKSAASLFFKVNAWVSANCPYRVAPLVHLVPYGPVGDRFSRELAPVLGDWVWLFEDPEAQHFRQQLTRHLQGGE